MDPLSIMGLAASGLKAGFGLLQGIGGRKRQKDLWANRPELSITEGEKSNDSLFRNLAASTELPGQQQYEGKLNEAYAGGVYDAQRTSTSSLGATQSAVDLAGKKMSAIQDLAGQFSEFKFQNQQNLANWNNQKTQLEQQRFQVNEYDPWGAKMNEAVGQKQAGFASFGSGVDSGAGMLNDMAGTNNYMKMYEKLYGNYGGRGGASPIMPSPSFNPQANLNNTLSGMFGKIKPNWG